MDSGQSTRGIGGWVCTDVNEAGCAREGPRHEGPLRRVQSSSNVGIEADDRAERGGRRKKRSKRVCECAWFGGWMGGCEGVAFHSE